MSTTNVISIYAYIVQNLLAFPGNKVISFQPYYVTQNLSGAYSLILNTFLCEADGVLTEATDEIQNIMN
ncbi:hypothetical protein Ccar_19420 [Clostridium carboxidivorans P7]|uniref:Uncharacterized protein n=1 Tax=Clostridium carboxidivorans P7 TaxID=536227 RepID=C6Q1T7_9CLOT|nr:hypothetical protein [Clostridium carboxidivorans]AKN32898.1 hypothetical protein Ccar_19420 [Clostridium carboxidivorans P7]EET84554.1 hypothetical protein CcarbDRAFT_5005 [Clostridium carboxidivorans P7]EFG89854.1 hypothetical protein CLCAR_0047 [Clostridium carboxidivorans P7]